MLYGAAHLRLMFSLQALSNQQKAVLMSERVMGIEHPNTIQEYVSSPLGIGWGGVPGAALTTMPPPTDAPGPLLLCQQPAVHSLEPSVPCPLPHAACVRGGPP